MTMTAVSYGSSDSHNKYKNYTKSKTKQDLDK